MNLDEDVYDYEAKQPIYRLQHTWKSIDMEGEECEELQTWCVKFSPSGQSIAVAGGDELKVFDAAGNVENVLYSWDGSIDGIGFYEVDWSKDGNLVATASDARLRVWNVNTGKRVKKLCEHEKFINSAKFSQDDSFILSGSDDCTAKLWDVKTGVCLNTLSSMAPVVGVDFHRDANRFMTISSGNCHIHDLRSMNIVQRYPRVIESAKFCKDYRYILFSTTYNSLKLYDMRKREVAGIYKRPNPSARYLTSDTNFALTASGKHIICSSFARVVYVWDVNTQELVQELIHSDSNVESVDCHPEDDIIVSGSLRDNLIKIWKRS